MKRLFDIGVAASALAVTAPLMALLSVAIKLDSPGPVLFGQLRVGLHQRTIRTWKLRSMIADAERHGPQITAGGDARITRVGRWLRKAKLDELPQLWNVLVGEMSIVGPRPEVSRYVEQYRHEWLRAFEVRPGLTDRASLTFRDEEELLQLANDRERAYREVLIPMKLELVLRDLDGESLGRDLRLIARTLAAVIRRPDPERDQIVAEARRRIEVLNATGGV